MYATLTLFGVGSRHRVRTLLLLRGVHDVVFCESFLSYVHRHPLLHRAVLSSLARAVLPLPPPRPSLLPATPPWASLAYWQARPQHALAITVLTVSLVLGSMAR